MAASVSPTSERQAAELALLASMYPTEHQPLQPLRADEAAKCALHLQPSYTLELTLPQQYPESAAPIAYLQCGESVSTMDRKLAREKLSKLVDWAWHEQRGECLDVLVEEFRAWLNEFCMSTSGSKDTTNGNNTPVDRGEPAKNGSKVSGRPGDAQTHHRSGSPSESSGGHIKRTLLWSHHLLATSKRKDIITWSRELRLGGYSRPGYPGAIFVEGEAGSVDEFVRRIKALRWQALQVRAEDVGRGRICGDGMEGVSEVESLGEVVDELRKRSEDVAEMFLNGMKISH